MASSLEAAESLRREPSAAVAGVRATYMCGADHCGSDLNHIWLVAGDQRELRGQLV